MEVVSVNSPTMDFLWELGLGLILASIIGIIIAIIIFFTDTVVHDWIFWVIVVLFVLVLFGILLFYFYKTWNNEKVVIV